MQKKIDRSKPPFAKTMLQFAFPKFEIQQISEDFKLYHYHDNSQPLALIKILAGRGAADNAIPGLAYLTSQMLTKGTKFRTAEQIALETDMLGANLNSSTYWDASALGITGLAEHLPKMLEILFDCFPESQFMPEEVERFKKKHLASIQQNLADPEYLAKIIFHRAIFGEHPYGKPLIGTQESINNITEKNCFRYHRQILNLSDLSIIACGNITKKQLLKYINKIDTFQKRITKSPLRKLKQVKCKQMQLALINKQNAEQTVLKIGKFFPGRNDEHYPDLNLANTVFGGYFLSRLNALLREELGYTYGVHSGIDSRRQLSVWTVSTSVKKSATSDSISRIIEEMDKFQRKPVTDEEFHRAKQYTLGAFLRSVESIQQICGMIQNLNIYNLEKEYYDTYYKRIVGITIDELFESQKKSFKPDSLTIAASGDIKILKKELKHFGEIVLFDERGNPQS